MKKKVTIASFNEKIVHAFEEEAELTLLAAERMVKGSLSTRKASAALRKLEKELAKEGINVKFEGFKRSELRASAVEGEEEIFEVVIDMAKNAVVADFEELLKQVDDELEKITASKHNTHLREKVKAEAAARIKKSGVNCRFKK